MKYSLVLTMVMLRLMRARCLHVLARQAASVSAKILNMSSRSSWGMVRRGDIAGCTASRLETMT
jgi:hypothetical protein